MASAEAIEEFCTFSGCENRELAAKFVKDANGDLNTAVSNYFEYPNKFDNWNPSYDENAFSADRYGDTQGTNVPSFNIHAPDDTGYSYTHSTAPTRPPSRAGNAGSQETGTVGGSGQYFGPATKENYETSQWALTTLTGGTATEIWPDVEPPKRERYSSDPGFVKPSAASDFLPALITILCSIPAAREVLLSRKVAATDYGADPNWWSGSTIKLPVVVDIEAEDREQQIAQNHRLDFVYEVQRLAAALEYSTRSYLSVDALASSHQMLHQRFDGQRIETQTTHFLMNWHDVSVKLLQDPGAERLIRTMISQSDGESPTDIKPFFQFDLPVANTAESPDDPSPLYDSIDEAFWAGDPDGTSNEQAWIEEAGDVLVFRVKQETKQKLKLDVPVQLFLDRYLKKNVVLMKEARQQMVECRTRLRSLNERGKQLRNFSNPKHGKSHEAADLLETAIQYASEQKRHELPDADGDVGMLSSQPSESIDNTLVTMLRKLSSRVHGQLEVLEKEKQRTLAALRDLSSLLRDFPPPTKNPFKQDVPQPEAVYTLCGVATDASTTYFRYPSSSEPGTASRCSVAYFSNPEFRLTQLGDEAVLEAVRASTERTALLVYARAGMEVPRITREDEYARLPDPLKAFVTRDSKLFADELADAQRQSQFSSDSQSSETMNFTNYTASDPPPHYAGNTESAGTWPDGLVAGGEGGGGFVPDPGETVVSTEEYTAQREMIAAREKEKEKAERQREAPGDRLNPGVQW